jgi:hypothetical protein
VKCPSYRPLFLAGFPGSNQKLVPMRLCMLRSVLLVASSKATKPTPHHKSPFDCSQREWWPLRIFPNAEVPILDRLNYKCSILLSLNYFIVLFWVSYPQPLLLEGVKYFCRARGSTRLEEAYLFPRVTSFFKSRSDRSSWRSAAQPQQILNSFCLDCYLQSDNPPTLDPRSIFSH